MAALVARATLLGLTDPPPASHREQAAQEGWIHLPLRGSLPFCSPSTELDDRLEPGARARAGARDDRRRTLTPQGYVKSL